MDIETDYGCGQGVACSKAPSMTVNVHTKSGKVKADVIDYNDFVSFEITVNDERHPETRVVFFLKKGDDAPLEAVVDGILRARPLLKEKIVREDTGPDAPWYSRPTASCPDDSEQEA